MTYMGPAYSPVMGAGQACQTSGCMMGQAIDLLARAEAALSQRKRERMSIALWCDPGGHAFSERDPGRQRITIGVLNDAGEEVDEYRDYCGDHAEAAGLLVRKTRPDTGRPQLMGSAVGRTPPPPPPDPGHYDPNVTATLEAGLGVGRVTSDPGQ